jgi:hypothetical protein
MSRLDAVAEFLGSQEVDEIKFLGQALQGARLQHVNSTMAGGGVAEILARLTPMMREVGVEPEWTVMEAEEGFFEVTKNIHNALHGESIRFTLQAKEVFYAAVVKNLGKINVEAGCNRRRAKIAARGIRVDRDRGDVERQAGGRWSGRRYPPANYRRGHRVSR